jgi:predicted permease
MRAWENLRMRFEMLFHRRREAERLEAELQFHLEQQIAENLTAGMSAKEARRAAVCLMGNPTVLREQVRETWLWTWLEQLVQDFRYALRQLWRSPGFVLVTVLTLTLGIGANTAIFTLMNALLLQTLPVADPERLARIGLQVGVPNADTYGAPLNFPIIRSLERHSHSFSGIFGWSDYGLDLKEGDSLRSYPGALVSGNTFEVLGVRPAAGRLLSRADDQPGGGPDGWAAMISHQFWVQHYDANPSVIGRHVTLSGYSATIVGVTPANFEGVIVTSRPDFYMPLEYEPVMRQRQKDSMLYLPGNLWLTTMGRLGPGVTLSQASAEMSALTQQVMKDTWPPQTQNITVVQHARFVALSGRSGWSDLRIRYTQPLLLIQMLVSAVLLVCCANLAGLGLARASARQREFTLRATLGAPRLRMLRQMLVESFLLVIPGALLGLGFAWGASRVLVHLMTTGWDRFPTALSTRPDMMVLSVTAGCAVFCAVLSGAAPAWIASRAAPEAAPGRAPKGLTRMEKSRLRQGFVCVQVALSLALVVVAGLLSATLVKLYTDDTGFRTKNIAFVMVDFRVRPERGVTLTHLYWQMAARLQEISGVEMASVATSVPISNYSQPYSEFSVVDGKMTSASPVKQPVAFNEVGANFFSTLGVPMLAGRDFANNDSDANTCIVSESAASKLFPHASALGGTLRQYRFSMDTGKTTTNECAVIGLVADAKSESLRVPAPPTVYRPIAADMPNPGLMNFAICARSLTEGKNAYLKVLHEIAPGTEEFDLIPFTVQIENSISIERLLASLSGFFAGLALLLSGIGIYGLISWSVTQRTMEFGVRIALGSTPVGIVLLVLRQIVSLVLVGALAGGVAAYASARAIRSFLFGVAPANPVIFASAGCVLCLIALIAALLPARRAVSIDPVEALRTE